MTSNKTLNFFDNPPNMVSQKKTGHYPSNFTETFEEIEDVSSPPLNSTHTCFKNLEWRKNDKPSRIPEFEESIYGKTTFVIGRRQSGKTTLIKNLVNQESERLRQNDIINQFTKIIIVSKSDKTRSEYEKSDDLVRENKQSGEHDWERFIFLSSLEEVEDKLNPESGDPLDNSLIIIEDDIIISESFKSPSNIQSFFTQIKKRKITFIAAIHMLSGVHSSINNWVDYLFLCKNLPYSELQRIGNAFLSIKLNSFIRIYNEIVIDNTNIAVVNISPENLKPQVPGQNMMKLLYHYPFSPINNDVKTVQINEDKHPQEEQQISVNSVLSKSVEQSIDDIIFNLNLLKTQLKELIEN